MFATLGDLVNYYFGINLSFLYIFQMFGLMMGAAFLTSAYILHLELKRKEKQGLIHAVQRSVVVGKPATTFELVLNAVLGFSLGFKVIGIIFNISVFIANPQAFVFSSQGSWVGGILIAAFFSYSKYYEKKKHQLPEPKTEIISLHPYQLVSEIVILAAVFGLIGAKVFANLEDTGYLLKNPFDALFGFSGLTWYGGLIFAAIAIIVFARRNKISVIHLADVVAPVLMMGYAVGRIGCQLAGDGDWGIENTAPKPHALSFLSDWMWAYTYPHNVNSEGIPIADCVGKHCNELAIPVFPTPFYETVMCLFIFSLLWFFRKKISIPGLLFSIYLLLNGVERFLIEQIRVNEHYHFFGISPTQAEIIAVLMMLLGIAGIFWCMKRKKNLLTSESN